MKIIKIYLILTIVLSLITGCSETVNKNLEPANTGSDVIFQNALSNPPSPSEARIVGTRIDAFFAGIAQADQEYLKQITAIKWGEVYDYQALNKTSKLPKLRKVNQKAKNYSIKVFEKRKKLYQTTITDLEQLAEKSIFAQAMLYEFKQKYNAVETGFLEIENQMRTSTLDKHDLIDEKLLMLSKAPGKYEILINGQAQFFQDDKGIELMNKYVENNNKHNQLTNQQRRFAQYFVKNQQNIVNRFHELSRQ